MRFLFTLIFAFALVAAAKADCPACKACAAKPPAAKSAPKKGVSVCVRARRCRVHIFRHRHCR